MSARTHTTATEYLRPCDCWPLAGAGANTNRGVCSDEAIEVFGCPFGAAISRAVVAARGGAGGAGRLGVVVREGLPGATEKNPLTALEFSGGGARTGSLRKRRVTCSFAISSLTTSGGYAV